MKSTDCIFCRIAAGDIPCAKLLETDEALAFLDVNPLTPGHALLIPKTHVERLDEMTGSLAGQVLRHLPSLARAVQQATGAPAYNILQNNGQLANQAVGHVHFHIIPRAPGDAFRFNWPAAQYAEGEMEAMRQKILAALE